MKPLDPVQAATHANPYPYYAELVAGPPLVFDERLRAWIAASAAAVTEVLLNPDCRVRPVAEPVPGAIAGSAAGEIFGRLVRMNEGERHARPKLALQRALAGMNPDTVLACAEDAARAAAMTNALTHADALNAWMHEMPVFAVGSLLGFERAALPEIAAWMKDFVACLSPLSTEEQIHQSSRAAQALLESFTELTRKSSAAELSLLECVKREADAAGWDDAHAVLANLVGLLSQTYDATAGLIGNSVVALLTRPELEAAMRAAPERIASLVQEVSRYDPPVQNTRRFVAQATSIAGLALGAGQSILLVLAAAGRDPAVTIRPHELLLDRSDPRTFGFGHGMHACPGQALACTMATAAIRELLQRMPSLKACDPQWKYRPSVNARIPLFSHPAHTAKEPR